MQKICHLSMLIHEQAKAYGAKPVLTYREFGSSKWTTISWNKFSLRVKQVSNALLNLGVKPQENLGVFSQNSAYSLFADFGAFGVRAVTVPLYATSSEQQLQYILGDAQIRILFVGEQEQYEKAHRVFALCPTLERIIVFDRHVRLAAEDTNAIYFDDFLKLGENMPRQTEVEALYGQANDDDIANILYTSGTTGDSKGVVLTYKQYKAATIANGKCVPVGENDRVMNFLPFSHIFERAWTFFAMSKGAEFIVNTNPHEIQQAMRETHPTCMCAVPRFWEKVYAGVCEKIEKASGFKRKLFENALQVGKKYNVDCLARGKRPSPLLSMKYNMYNRTLFKLIRKQLGLENAHFFPTAGSAVSPHVEEFVHSIGIYMMVGYGLTESTATVSCMHMNKPFAIGSVGRVIEGLQVKIGENDEILLKGPTITPSYYKREALNEAAFDKDGYFRTGDAGYIKNGELFLKERIKDLFKTSNGKYISPQMIETKLLVDKYIDQIAVIADEHKFVSALIIPEYRLLEEYAREHGIKFDSREDLCKDKRIVDMMMERIDTLQQQLANYEKVKRFTLLPRNFSMEAGELTNTLKIKRAVLNKNYAREIEEMYKE